MAGAVLQCSIGIDRLPCRSRILLLLFLALLLAAASQSSAVVMLGPIKSQSPVAVVGLKKMFQVQGNQIRGLLPSFAGLNSLNNTKISSDFFNGTYWIQSDNLEHSGPFFHSIKSVSSIQTFSATDHTNLNGVLRDNFGPFTYHLVDETIPITLLDASDNPIEGKVPDFSTVKKNGVGLEKRDVNTGSGTMNSVSILGLVVFFPVIAVVMDFILCRNKVQRSSHVTTGSNNAETRGIGTMESNVHQELEIVTDHCLVFSVQVLRNATDDFNENNILGTGGFGTVYRGELGDGTKIAVKRMKPERMSGDGLELLKSEISSHAEVRHVNVVKLVGYCLEGTERLLAFELMSQGTLDRFLFRLNDEGFKPLDWRKRIGIALDVARGVEHLHSFALRNFIHRDLKPANILLGDDMRAKIADFGLVRQVPPDEEASASAKFVGTFGYIAPEYAATGRVSRKTDVYSFGVVLMELITGRKAIDMSLPEEKRYIVAWFRRMKGNDFNTAIDPFLDLNDQETMSSIINVAELAGHCTSGEPKRRPGMTHVVTVLSSLVGGWKSTEPADPQESDGMNNSMTLAEMVQGWKAEGTSSHA